MHPRGKWGAPTIRRAWGHAWHGVCCPNMCCHQAQRPQPREGASWLLVWCDQHAPQARHRAELHRVDAVKTSAGCAREEWRVKQRLLQAAGVRVHRPAASCSTRAAHACRRCTCRARERARSTTECSSGEGPPGGGAGWWSCCMVACGRGGAVSRVGVGGWGGV
jgi:hypothetical protein